jgi:hypothetical protein
MPVPAWARGAPAVPPATEAALLNNDIEFTIICCNHEGKKALTPETFD